MHSQRKLCTMGRERLLVWSTPWFALWGASSLAVSECPWAARALLKETQLWAAQYAYPGLDGKRQQSPSSYLW